MKKSKSYKNTRFAPDTIQQAQKILERFLHSSKRREYYTVRQVTSGDETWNYDSDSEFFAEYTKTKGNSIFTKSFTSFTLDLFITEKETKVTVDAKKRDQIEAIFNVFDNVAQISKLKSPHPPIQNAQRNGGSHYTSGPTSDFSLERTLPSCLVTVELLNRLEGYLTSQIANIVNIPNGILVESLNLSVSDNLGIHRLTSISTFGLPSFSDNTHTVTLSLSIYTPKRLQVMLCFSRERGSSKLSVSLSDVQPRPLAISILNELEMLIRPNVTANWIFQPHTVIWGILLTIDWLSFVTYLSISDITIKVTAAITSLLITFYLFVAKPLKHYTEFDSNLYHAKKKWIDWFVLGLMTFLVFGTLFIAIRKTILGF